MDECVSFTIDPEELEEASQRQIHVAPGGTHYGKTPPTPPINKTVAQEEDISLLLGTLQVPRGRSTSVTQSGNKVVTPPKVEGFCVLTRGHV